MNIMKKLVLFGILTYFGNVDVFGQNNFSDFIDVTCEKVICDYISEMHKKNVQNDEGANVIAFECLVKIGKGEEHNAIIILKHGRFDDPSNPRYVQVSNSGVDAKTLLPVYYIPSGRLINSVGGIQEYSLLTKKARINVEWEEKIAKFAALDEQNIFIDPNNLLILRDASFAELQFAVLKKLVDTPIKLADDMYITLTGIQDVTQIYTAFKPQYDDLYFLKNGGVSVSYFEEPYTKHDKIEENDVFQKISCEDYCNRKIQ